MTDLFDDEYTAALERAKAVLPRLASDYDRAYYEGMIHERWAKAQTARKVPSHVVRGWYLHAMHCYERAEAVAPPDNPDAILRWNTCARVLAQDEAASLASRASRATSRRNLGMKRERGKRRHRVTNEPRSIFHESFSFRPLKIREN